MKHILKLAILFFLSTFFFSCKKHSGVPAEEPKQVRLKRLYISTAMVPSRAYNHYHDFSYDGSGRVSSVSSFVIENEVPLMNQKTAIYYDSKGRMEGERTEGIEARSVRYGYDSHDRVQDVWVSTDGLAGISGYHIKYDGSGMPSERLYYSLNAEGDSTTRSLETYVFDSKGNLERLVQNYSSRVNPPSIRTATYKYDDKPNPWLHLPILIFRFSAFFNSQNNVIESAGVTTYFPPTTSVDSSTHQFNNKYNNGLLEEAEYDQQYAWKYVYETF